MVRDRWSGAGPYRRGPPYPALCGAPRRGVERQDRGQDLFQALFCGPIGELWHRSLGAVSGKASNLNLCLEVEDGVFRLPPVPKELAAGYVATFWNPAGFVRPQGRLLVQARAIPRGEHAVSALLENLPVDALYPEQVAFGRDERRVSTAFFEEWCQYVLERERERGIYGGCRFWP